MGCGIPEEAWIGKKVSYSFIKTFGCEAFAHIDSENRTKLEAKSKKCPVNVRWSTRKIRPLEIFSPSLYSILLTNVGELECYVEVV